MSHMEYIGSVSSPSAANDFASQTYGINPGDAGTFPWLATLANSFEEYSWLRLSFLYKTTSSDAVVSTSTSLNMGLVILGTQYNSNAPAFTTRQQMELYQGTMSTKPSLSATHYVECRRNLTPYQTLYIRPNTHFLNDTSMGPLQNYDIGQFTIATSGVTPGVVGELWARYVVVLKKPKLSLINQPFLAAQDLFYRHDGNAPAVPQGPGNANTLLQGLMAGPFFVTSYPEAPGIFLTAARAPNINTLGCAYVNGVATGGTHVNERTFLRFPDEAPPGTVIRVTIAFTINTGAAGTYTWIPPVIGQSAAGGSTYPPAVNTYCGMCLVRLEYLLNVFRLFGAESLW